MVFYSLVLNNFKGVEFNFGLFLLRVLMFLNNFLFVPRDGLVLIWVFKPSKIAINFLAKKLRR